MRTAFEGPEPSAPPAAAVSTLSAKPSMRAVEVRGLDALAAHRADWDDLCRDALEPNPFYESWMLLPAVEAFGQGLDLRFLFVYAEDKADRSALPLLCGLFPLERKMRYKGLPVDSFVLWRHLHCFLCTPPVRAGFERECLETFFDWLRDSPDGAGLIEFGWINTDGPLFEALEGYLSEAGKTSFVSDRFTRALYRPGADADSYLSQAISKEHRRDYRRRHNRLSERGRLEYVALGSEADVEEWLEIFLTLEASGWKGREGSAFRSGEAGQKFFIEAMTEAFERGRLMMLAIKLDDSFIALKCNLIAGPGSFAFKITYDEDYARFCPGVLLELENVRLLHCRPEIEWMDSCAEPNHFMMNRLWTGRRDIVDLVVSTGTKAGNLAISSFPLLRWISRKLFRPALSIFSAGLEITG